MYGSLTGELSEGGGRPPSSFSYLWGWWTERSGPYLALCVTGAVAASAMERLAFKAAVDLAGPLRFVVAQVVTVGYVAILGVWVGAKAFRGKLYQGTLSFPKHKMGIIALLEATQLIMTTVSGAWVSPTLTLLLLQGSLPLAVMFSSTPKEGDLGAPRGLGRAPRWVRGAGIAAVFVAVVLSLVPLLLPIEFGEWFGPYALSTTEESTKERINSLLYLASAIPAASSQVYREQSLMAHSQPVDPSFLSLCITFFVLMLLIFLAPAVYHLQALGGSSAAAYPPSLMASSLRAGWICCVGGTQPPEDSYAYGGALQPAQCRPVPFLIILYIGSVVLLGGSFERIVGKQKGGGTANAALTGGILLGFILLALYAALAAEVSVAGSACSQPKPTELTHPLPPCQMVSTSVNLFTLLALGLMLPGIQALRSPESFFS
jgi:hypothetical protein